MLDAQALPVVRVEGVGDVPGGEDPGSGGGEVLVDEDPVVDGQSCRLGELGTGSDADSDDDDVGSLDAAVAEDDCFDGLGAPQFGDPGAQPEVHAVVGVEAGEHGTDVVAEDALQRDWSRIDEDDLGAHLPGRRRDLGADPPGADHDHAGRGADGVAKSLRVVDGAEVVDATEVRSGDAEASGDAPVARTAVSKLMV